MLSGQIRWWTLPEFISFQGLGLEQWFFAVEEKTGKIAARLFNCAESIVYRLLVGESVLDKVESR